MALEWKPINSAKKASGVPIMLAWIDERGKRRVSEGYWGLGRYDRSKRDYERAWCIGVQVTVPAYAWAELPEAPDPKDFQKERAE